MISEVLLNLLMITCILIWVSSKEVKWTVRDTPKVGQDLTLFCKVDNVNGTKIWRGGPDDKVLMVNSGVSTDKAKYNTAIEKNGFILTILNLTVEDFNVSYECSCGFYLDNHILYMEDVYTVHKLNKTTNGTNYVGTNYARGATLKITLSITIIIVLSLFVVFIIKSGSFKRLREKFGGSRRTKSDEVDSQNVTDPILQATHVDSNLRQSSDLDDNLHRSQLLQPPQESINRVTDRDTFKPSMFLPIHQQTNEDRQRSAEDDIYYNLRLSSGTVHVDYNPRQSTDEVDSQNVTDPLLKNTLLDSNLRQSSDEADSQNVTYPLLETTPVDFNLRQSSGSSLQSADVNLNQIQCTDEVDSQNVTDPLLHTTPVDLNLRQCTGSSLPPVLAGSNLGQSSDEDVTPSSEQDIDHDLLIKNVTAVESFAPSTRQEIRNEIGEGKTDR